MTEPRRQPSDVLEIARLEEISSQLVTENLRLRHELEESRAKNELLQAEAAGLKAQGAGAIRALRECRDEGAELREQIELWRQSHSDICAYNTDRLQGLESENARLSRQIDAILADCGKYEAERERLESENAQLHGILKELYSRVDLAFRAALSGDNP